MQNHFARYTITNKFGKTSPNAIFKNALSNSLKALVCIAKQRPEKSAVCIGDPNGIRTHITTVKG